MANEDKKSVLEVGGNSAGRVAVDGRGRNVWQWNDEQLDSTTIMLSRLDNDALELEPTRSVPIPGGQSTGSQSTGGQSTGDDRKKKRADRREPCIEGLSIEATLNVEATLNIESGSGFDPYNRS